MKKICLIVLLVLLLPVTSAFALVVGSPATGQQVLLPYVVNVADGSWWSGLAIVNTSGSSMTFSIGAYDEDGTWVSGNSFTVAAHAMEVRAVGAFFTTPPTTDRFSVLIRCATDEAPSFQVALFVGSSEGGFGFQTTTSWDWDYTTGVFIDPLWPIVVPKFPIPILPVM